MLNPTLEAEDQQVLLALRQARAKLLARKLEIVRADGLPFYRPLPKQDAFHQAGVRYRRRMMRAGNRSGKSHMGCAEDCAWMRRERPWYPEGHPARRGGIPQRPIKLLTITTDWDKVDEIWTSQSGEFAKVWKMLPRNGFVKKVHRNHSGAIAIIEANNGSVWCFDTVKSFKANPQGSESSDWDAIHVDEPCPQAMWKAASRGLMDRHGSAWFTLTALEEAWMNDMFFPDETGQEKRENIWAVTGSTWENDTLSREAIQEFSDSLSEEERQCRIDGVPLHLAGLVYREFQWADHVIDTPPAGWEALHRPPRNWPIYVAIDPHPRTPHAVLFCTVDPFGNRYYFYDTFVHCSIRDLVMGSDDGRIQGIVPFLKGYRLVWSIMDPLGFIEHPITMTSMATEMDRYGLYPDKAPKALAEGILRVQAGLKAKNHDGTRPINFCTTAKRTLWEIRRYSWKKDEDKPVDIDDHMMENLYRMELTEPRWVDLSHRAEEFPEMVIDRPMLDLPQIIEVV